MRDEIYEETTDYVTDAKGRPAIQGQFYVRSVAIDTKLIQHMLFWHERDKDLSGYPLLEYMAMEAARLNGKGMYDGFYGLTLNGKPEQQEGQVPESCVDVELECRNKGVVIHFKVAELGGENTITVSWDRLRDGLSHYQKEMVRDDYGTRDVYAFAAQDDRRRMQHENTARKVLGWAPFGLEGEHGPMQIVTHTAYNLMSVLGFLFPRGPAQDWMDRKLPPVPLRPWMKFNDTGQLLIAEKDFQTLYSTLYP